VSRRAAALVLAVLCLAATATACTRKPSQAPPPTTTPPAWSRPIAAIPVPADALSLTPDGRTLVILTRGTVQLWSLADHAQPSRSSTVPDTGARVNGTAVSPDGRILATANSNGKADLWNIVNPEKPTLLAKIDYIYQPPLLNFGGGQAYAVAFSPDGHNLATAGWYGDPVRLWNVTDPTKPVSVSSIQHANTVSAIAFSPNGKTLVVADTETVLWDVSNPANPHAGGLLDTLKGHVVRGLAFSSDGGVLATDAGGIVLWNVSAPTNPRKLRDVAIQSSEGVSEEPTCVAFTSGGRLVIGMIDHPTGIAALSFKQSGSVDFVTAADGTRIFGVVDTDGPITTMVLLPDGRTLITGGSQTTKVWTGYP
jgi:WD40 repeat protein